MGRNTTPADADIGVVLAARDLEKVFFAGKGAEVRALKGVSLKARKGEVTGLVGADGAGKTTLIRIAAGLMLPSRGSVSVLGFDSVQNPFKIQSRIGYMPQKFGLYQDLTVQENLDLYADLQGVPISKRMDRFERLMKMTGLAPFTRRRAGDLSGGMKQKLGLACSLIKRPGMLLLDEPTVGVDPVSRRELWKIVYEMVEDEGIGVLLSTAYLDEAERCHHVIVLDRGRKLAEGPPENFRGRLKNRVFLITPPPNVKPRQIQRQLAGKSGIGDVSVRSGHVRAVASAPDKMLIAEHLPEDFLKRIQLTNPIFEDAFMTLIPKKEARPVISADPEVGKKSGNGCDTVVHTRDLQKFFGEFEAVKRISFDVRRGEIFGLLGPNGAGKSTTFRMLCGLLPASAGEVSVAGRDLRRSAAHARQRLGYMAQQFSLYAQLSVYENFRFYGRAYGLGGKRLKQRVDWAYEEFGLSDWYDHEAGKLPGGIKQRLAMATALLHEPDILFLDEPTSGVDPLARREFWLRINRFAEQGVTVVVTTHFMEESEYCDRMLIMSAGEMLALGTPEEIRSLARTDERPEPTIEDAFIALAEGAASGSDVKPISERSRE
ncbi:MAG: ATP-binding cassette domain-containing protein [Desulfobacterales bacterium]